MKRAYLLAALLLAGCGGGASSFVEGTTGTVSLTFVRGTGYTGGSGALTAFDSLNGSAINNAIDAQVTKGTRSVSVTLLGNPLVAGTSIDLSSGNGSSVTYRDANGQWNASAGTVTVSSRTTTSVTLTFASVVLDAAGSGANGSVVMSGALTFTTS